MFELLNPKSKWSCTVYTSLDSGVGSFFLSLLLKLLFTEFSFPGFQTEFTFQNLGILSTFQMYWTTAQIRLGRHSLNHLEGRAKAFIRYFWSLLPCFSPPPPVLGHLLLSRSPCKVSAALSLQHKNASPGRLKPISLEDCLPMCVYQVYLMAKLHPAELNGAGLRYGPRQRRCCTFCGRPFHLP